MPKSASAISLETCKTFLKNCFTDVSDNLQCHIEFDPKNECKLKNADNLCQSFEHALNCSMSIRDLGCDFGKETMEAWMNGLMGSYKTLCVFDTQHTHIHNLIDIPNCWNVGKFLTCTEEKVAITHIVDLLTHELDIRECNVLMIAVALCNEKAEKRKSVVCKGSSTAVLEALTSFFAESSCMEQITKELVNEHCESVAQKRATIAGLSTLVLMILVVAGVTFLLVRRRTVILNTRFRFTNDEDNSAFIS